jgi:hypothetical protein
MNQHNHAAHQVEFFLRSRGLINTAIEHRVKASIVSE